MFEKLKAFFHKEQTSKKEKIISAILAFGYVSLLGSYGQSAMEGEYFQTLPRPDFQPPDWVFGVVWPVLFALLAASLYYAWNHYKSEDGRKLFTALYALNGLLLAAWTNQFVIQQSLTGGLYVLITLIVVAELMIITGFYTNKKSSYLLIPYLLWILFATYLNVSIMGLSG